MSDSLTSRSALDRTKLLREKVRTSDKSRMKIKELETSMRWYNDIVAFLVIGGLILAIWETDVIFIRSKGKVQGTYAQSGLSLALKIIISVTTLAALFFHNAYYGVRYQFEVATGICFGSISKGKIKPEDTYSTSGLGKQQLIESLVIFIHPIPGWDFTIPLGASGGWVYYSSDVIFMLFMLFRLVIIGRLCFHHSMYMNQASRDLAAINSVRVDNFFIIKCWLKHHSVTMLSFLFILLAASFAFAVRALERNINHKFDDFFNAFWLMVVTMTTVGYGDMYPETHLGRAYAIFACISAIVMLSLMVLGITHWLSLETHEQRVVDLITRNKMVRSRNDVAASIITDLYRRKISGRRPDSSLLGTLKQLRDARRSVSNLEMEGSNVYLLNQKLLRETRQELDAFKKMVNSKMGSIKEKVGVSD